MLLHDPQLRAESSYVQHAARKMARGCIAPFDAGVGRYKRTSRGLDAPATSARDEMSQHFELASERFQAHNLALEGYAQLMKMASS